MLDHVAANAGLALEEHADNPDPRRVRQCLGEPCELSIGVAHWWHRNTCESLVHLAFLYRQSSIDDIATKLPSLNP